MSQTNQNDVETALKVLCHQMIDTVGHIRQSMENTETALREIQSRLSDEDRRADERPGDYRAA